MQQFLLLLLRFSAAIVVSCIVSYTVIFCMGLLLMWAGMLGIILNFVTTGFCGVFAGTLCLPRSCRRFGSVVLLVLGLAYYAYFQVHLDIPRAENHFSPFVWLIPLAGGAAMSLVLIWKRSPNQSIQAKVASPRT